MASKRVSYCSPPSKPATYVISQSPADVSKAPINYSKMSEAKKPKVLLHNSQDELGNPAKQPTGSPEPCTSEPRSFYHLDLCPLPPGKLPAPEPQLPSPIPEATDTRIREDGSARLPLTHQPCVLSKSLIPSEGPPTKPPSAVATRQEVKIQQSSEKKQGEEKLRFRIDLVLFTPDLSDPDIPEHLPVPEATEVTIPMNPR